MSFSVYGLSSYYDTVSSNAQSSSRSDKATSALSMGTGMGILANILQSSIFL